jgi:hypothetical protein
MTRQILSIHHLSGNGVGPNPYPSAFLGLTWCCAVFELLAFCLRWLEIRTGGCEGAGAGASASRDVEVERGIELDGRKGEWERWETSSKDS